MREGEDALAAAEKLLNQRRLPEAVDLLSPWVEEHPDDTRAWELLAAVRLQLQDWPRAEQHGPGASEMTNVSLTSRGKWPPRVEVASRIGDVLPRTRLVRVTSL